MKSNLGTTDRIVRIVLAIAIVYLYATGQINGTALTVLGIIGAALFLTSLVGFCPAYYPFKFSTKKAESK